MIHVIKIRSIPFVIAFIAMIAMLPSCGGGGGGGGGGDGTVVIPDEFYFTMDLDVDGQEPFNLSYASDPVNKVITMRTIDAPFNGTFSYETGDYTFAPCQINVTNAEWSEPYKTFAINITSDIVGAIDEHPSDGSVQVYDGLNTITIEIIANGLTISLNGAPSLSYSWSDFYALYLDANEDSWKREASLAGTILKFLEGELSFTASSLEIIETEDDTLADDGYITYNCSDLPIDPPLGEGRRTLTADSGGVGPGSNFTWSYDYCWSDDPSSTEDPLYNGTISLLGFLELVDESGSTETITAIGFVPDVTPGGVYYNGFREYLTSEDNQGNVTIVENSALIYNGGYSIMFYTE